MTKYLLVPVPVRSDFRVPSFITLVIKSKYCCINYIIIPTITAVNKHANVPAIKAKIPNLDKSFIRDGQ